MAAMRNTQKDVGRFEAKFVGPFTTRQAISVGAAAVVAFVLFFILRGTGMDDMSNGFTCALAAVPVILVGCWKPYGLKMEDFLVQYYVYHVASPKVRPYRTETDLDLFMAQWEKEKAQEAAAGKKKGKDAGEGKKHKHVPDPEYPEYL